MEDREAWGASPWGRKELDTATEQQTPSCNKQVVRWAVEPQHYMTLHDVQVPMAISQKQKKEGKAISSTVRSALASEHLQ